ncbi:hypothetical protein ACJH6J_20230 [Mycobacterium sp. SMC-18]|uniref:hypothetical protein n=1 Tax=unclassified Mycobacterium TaxID=2642494 RepID=UPI0038773556
MDAIHADMPQVESSNGGWSSIVPSQEGIHPVPTPGLDALSGAVSGAVAEWPAVHEEFVAGRVNAAGKFVAANGGTIANISTAEATNTAQIDGIEV